MSTPRARAAAVVDYVKSKRACPHDRLRVVADFPMGIDMTWTPSDLTRYEAMAVQMLTVNRAVWCVHCGGCMQ